MISFADLCVAVFGLSNFLTSMTSMQNWFRVPYMMMVINSYLIDVNIVPFVQFIIFFVSILFTSLKSNMKKIQHDHYPKFST